MEQKPKTKETKVKYAFRNLIWDEKQANCLFRAIVAYFEYANTFALDLIIVWRHMAKKIKHWHVVLRTLIKQYSQN